MNWWTQVMKPVRGKFAQAADGTWPSGAMIMGSDGSLRHLLSSSSGRYNEGRLPTCRVSVLTAP